MKLQKFKKFESSTITKSNENGTYIIYSGDDGINELYRGKFESIDTAWKKADEIYVEKNQELVHYDVVGPFHNNRDINKWKVNEEFTGGVDSNIESKNLFGFAQVKDQTIKKIGSFTSFTKMINPPTPKERPVLNAGQFIDNDIVQGYVNRIEGGKVFVESIENPGEIIEISLKDAIKIKKVEKNHTVTKKIEEKRKTPNRKDRRLK